MSNFIEIDNGALFKQMPSEAEWIPESHLARFLQEVVSQLDLHVFNDAYRGCGSRAYSPALLLTLLMYGYLTGVFSSRKIEAATYDSIAFRYLAGNVHPDHSSLASFRKRFQDEFKTVFSQVLVIAHDMGIARMGRVAVDGTKVSANASRHTALSYAHAVKIEAQLRREVEQLMAEADKADNAKRPEGFKLPAEIALRQARLDCIGKAKARIEQRAAKREASERVAYEAALAKRKAREAATGKKCGGRPPKEPPSGPRSGDQVNLTDEESRIMPVSGGGFEQAYNAQAAVDLDTMLVMAVSVTQATNDKEQVAPMLEALAEAPACLGRLTTFVADTGYHSAANVELCLAAKVEPVIAEKRESHHPDVFERFTEPAALPPDATPAQCVAHRAKTIAGRALYALRKQTVEPVFGIIKSVMGFRHFSMRGLAAARNEWAFVCAVWNVKRMAVLRPA